MTAENRPSKHGPYLVAAISLSLMASGCGETLPLKPVNILAREPKPIFSKPEEVLIPLPKETISSPSPEARKEPPTEKTPFSNPTQTLTPEPFSLPTPEVTIFEAPSQLSKQSISFLPDQARELKHPWLEPPEETMVIFTPTTTPKPTVTRISPLPSPTLTTQPKPSPRSSEIQSAEIILSPLEDEAFQAVNQIRKEENLPRLEISTILTEVARDRTNDMIEKGYFSHISPDGETVFKLLSQKDFPTEKKYVGEILARNNFEKPVPLMMAGFLQSPTHRMVLLRSQYRLVGIGYAEKDGIKYITIIFSS